ncbi:MAG: tetratricopeptide repeat protein, partial [Hymenobacter sp.]
MSHCSMVAYGQVREKMRPMTGPSPDNMYVRLNQQLAQARQRGDLSEQADRQQQLGLLLYHQGNYASGIRHLLHAQSILRRTNQADRLAENLNQLGTVYYYNRQPRLARRQFDEAEAIYQRTTNWLGLAQTYG